MCKGLFEQCYIFHKQFNVVFLILVSETDLFTKGKEISQAAFNATEVRYREISKGIVQTNQGKNRLYKRYAQVQLRKQKYMQKWKLQKKFHRQSLEIKGRKTLEILMLLRSLLILLPHCDWKKTLEIQPTHIIFLLL